MIITLLFFIPASVAAQIDLKEKLLEKFNVSTIDQDDIIENGDFFSATLNITMLDGKEFSISFTLDKKNLKATFEFASGKTIILKPTGIEETRGYGYQEHDDIDNTANFSESIGAFGSSNCALYIIVWLITPPPISWVFLYLAIVSC